MIETDAVVITADFYKARELLGYMEERGFCVDALFRTYHADAMFASDDPPSLVIGDLTCKDRVECNEPVKVFYNAHRMAKEVGARFLPMWLPKPILLRAVSKLPAVVSGPKAIKGLRGEH